MAIHNIVLLLMVFRPNLLQLSEVKNIPWLPKVQTPSTPAHITHITNIAAHAIVFLNRT